MIDMRSMADRQLHGSGTRLVNSHSGIQLQIDRKGEGSGNVECHIFVISDAQFNVMDRQFDSVLY